MIRKDFGQSSFFFYNMTCTSNFYIFFLFNQVIISDVRAFVSPCAPCGSPTERAEEKIRLRTGGVGNQATVGCVTGRTGVQRVTVGVKQRRRQRETDPGLRLKHPSLRLSCRHRGLRRKRRFIGRRRGRKRRRKKSWDPTNQRVGVGSRIVTDWGKLHCLSRHGR